MEWAGGRYALYTHHLLLQFSVWEQNVFLPQNHMLQNEPRQWASEIFKFPLLFWLRHSLKSFMMLLIKSASEDDWICLTAYIITIKLITCQSHLVMIKKDIIWCFILFHLVMTVCHSLSPIKPHSGEFPAGQSNDMINGIHDGKKNRKVERAVCWQLWMEIMMLELWGSTWWYELSECYIHLRWWWHNGLHSECMLYYTPSVWKPSDETDRGFSRAFYRETLLVFTRLLNSQ